MLSRTIFLLGAMMMGICTANGGDPPAQYLSDLPHRILYNRQAWGLLGYDVAAHTSDKTPLSLRIKDKVYAKGIGTHADGEIVIALDGAYDVFESDIGVQWRGQNTGSVEFQVFADGRKLFESGVMKEDAAAKHISLPVKGVQELQLVVTDGGDGITCDCANWADARLIPSASPAPKRATRPFDATPFARVCTWDPARMDGCKSNRVQEFRAEDLFLETDVLPDAKACYAIPAAANGQRCIGLQWLERRRLSEVALEFAGKAPQPDGVEVQGWVGESIWQGHWIRLKGDVRPNGDSLSFAIDLQANPDARGGLKKVRWVFPAGAKLAPVKKLSAQTQARWTDVGMSLTLAKPAPGKRGEVEVYNGEFDGSASRTVRWDLSKPLKLKVRSVQPRPWQPDRTILRFRLPGGTFGVAVEDVVNNGCVWVPHAGLFVSRTPGGPTLAAYLKQVKTKKTVLERVRRMPDQTFAQALAKTRNPVQDSGPVLLSLACDNRKFVLQREGMLQFATAPDKPDQLLYYPQSYAGQMAPQFGSGRNQGLTRSLDSGWLPVPIVTVKDGGVIYSQRTFVAPLDDETLPAAPWWLKQRPVCVAEFTLDNPQTQAADATLSLGFLADAETKQPADVVQAQDGILVKTGDRLLARIETDASPLQARVTNGAFALSGTLPARTQVVCRVYLPTWEMKPDSHAQLTGARDLRARLETYWRRVMEPAVQIRVPDPMLENVILASQVHCLIAARNEKDGETVAPWIASMVYGPLESEANSIIRGMDMLGHEEFARKSLEFFIRRYNKEGFLTTGYTLMGTGWQLWSLGEHFELTHDDAWLQNVASEVSRVCQWIVRQRMKTMKLDANGRKVPEYGLMPPGVQADWNAFSYHFSLNGYYYAGLNHAARALQAIDFPGSHGLVEGMPGFREDILRAYKWTQSRAPVFPLKDGTWVPEYPGSLFCPGPTNTFFPGEDGNRSWCYDVELGAHQLVPHGVLDPNGQETAWMIDHMEDVQFLATGWFDYPAESNEADWFNKGGFAKVQPYYCRNAEICAMRDDVKPFIRSYFNSIASLLNTEVLSFWEHFHSAGAWNKTHETGYFLQQTRFMLVTEHGEELWLAPLVTSNWMRDGMTVSAKNAPTRFGPVSYSITSHADDGYIDAVIDTPTREAPAAVVVRLRHPEGKPMKSVTVNGKATKTFDPVKEIVRIKEAKGKMTVRARY